MARKKRWREKREEILKGTGYDSILEKHLHETVLSSCEFHPRDKLVSYSVTHTYEPDFIFQRDDREFLIEVKGRFTEAAEARKYLFIREFLRPDQELVFILQKANTRFPFARKRKDGTYQTHEEWLEKNGFRYWVQTEFELSML